jgi:hypothetical protein
MLCIASGDLHGQGLKGTERKEFIHRHAKNCSDFQGQFYTGTVGAPLKKADGLWVNAESGSELLAAKPTLYSEQHNSVMNHFLTISFRFLKATLYCVKETISAVQSV